MGLPSNAVPDARIPLPNLSQAHRGGSCAGTSRHALVERSKRYSEACGYEFCVAEGDEDMVRIQAELLGFLRRIVHGHGSDMGLVGTDMQDLGLEGIARSQRPQLMVPGAIDPGGATPVEIEPIPLVGGTFFVSLTCKDVRELIDTGKILELAQGTSAMELRVDLLGSWDMDFVRDQCARLRRSCPLPVIYTVRTKSQVN